MRKLSLLIILLLIIPSAVVSTFAQDDMMHLRVAHWSADAPAVDIYADGEVVIENLEFPMVTEWIELPEGNYELAVAPAGTSVDEAVIGPAIFNLVEDTWITVAAVGSADADTLAFNVLIEDYNLLVGDDLARLSITHAIAGAPPISVVVDDVMAVTSLAYPGTEGVNDGFYIRSFPAGTADMSVIVTNFPDTVLATTEAISIEADMNYLIAAIGTEDSAQLLVIASSLDGEMVMSNADDMVMVDVDAMSATEEPMDEDNMADEEMDADATEEVAATEEPMDEEDMTDEEVDAVATEEVVATEEPMEDMEAEVTPEATEEAVATEEVVATEEPMEDMEAEVTPEATDEPVMDDETAEAVATEEPMDEDMSDDETVEAVATEEAMDEDMSEGDMEAESTEEPMEDMEAEVTPDATEEAMMTNTIADIVIVSAEGDEPEFTILLAAIAAADDSILAALSDPEADYTVFAPTDEAFEALLELLEIDMMTLITDTELLNTVLQYHVIEGAMMADAIIEMDGEAVPTLLGDDATISISLNEDGVVLNDTIVVIDVDIEADNGVIHVIDGVLLPGEG